MALNLTHHKRVFKMKERVLADPDLADHLVPQCWYRGGICPEAKCCGLNKSVQAEDYYKLFKN